MEALRRTDHHGAQERTSRARSVGAPPPLRGLRRGHHGAPPCARGAPGVQPVPPGDHLRRRRGHRRLRPRDALHRLERLHGADDRAARRPGPGPARGGSLPVPRAAGRHPPDRAGPRGRDRDLRGRRLRRAGRPQRLRRRHVQPAPERGRRDRRRDRPRARRHRAPARRAGPAGERGALPQHGRRGARHDLDGRRRGHEHLLQQALARLHGPLARAGVRKGLPRRNPPRRPPGLRHLLRPRVRRARRLPNRIPTAAPRRGVPLDPRDRDSPLHRVRRVRGVHRVRPRHHRPANRRGVGARERGALPLHGRCGARHDLARRRECPGHVLQQAVARLHRTVPRGGAGTRLVGWRVPGRPPAHPGGRGGGPARAPAVPDGVPPATARRRVPVDLRRGASALHAVRDLRGLHRLLDRRHGAPADRAAGPIAARVSPPRDRRGPQPRLREGLERALHAGEPRGCRAVRHDRREPRGQDGRRLQRQPGGDRALPEGRPRGHADREDEADRRGAGDRLALPDHALVPDDQGSPGPGRRGPPRGARGVHRHQRAQARGAAAGGALPHRRDGELRRGHRRVLRRDPRHRRRADVREEPLRRALRSGRRPAGLPLLRGRGGPDARAEAAREGAHGVRPPHRPAPARQRRRLQLHARARRGRARGVFVGRLARRAPEARRLHVRRPRGPELRSAVPVRQRGKGDVDVRLPADRRGARAQARPGRDPGVRGALPSPLRAQHGGRLPDDSVRPHPRVQRGAGPHLRIRLSRGAARLRHPHPLSLRRGMAELPGGPAAVPQSHELRAPGHAQGWERRLDASERGSPRRRGRRRGHRRGHRHGHHRAQAPRGAAAAVPEDGGHRSAGGRDRPRLQQPADHGHRLQRHGAPAALGAGSHPRGDPGDPARRREGGEPDPPAAGVLAQAGVRLQARGPERAHHRRRRRPSRAWSEATSASSRNSTPR